MKVSRFFPLTLLLGTFIVAVGCGEAGEEPVVNGENELEEYLAEVEELEQLAADKVAEWAEIINENDDAAEDEWAKHFAKWQPETEWHHTRSLVWYIDDVELFEFNDPSNLSASFSDWEYTEVDIVADPEQNMTTQRLVGEATYDDTGNTVEFTLAEIYKWEDGQVTDLWFESNMTDVYYQAVGGADENND